MYNLSKKLTKAETTILDNGLKFLPPQKCNKFQTYMYINKYTSKLNVKIYLLTNLFKNNRINPMDIQNANLSNTSLFNPQGGLAPLIGVFRDVLLRDLDNIRVQKFKMEKELEAGLDQLQTEGSKWGPDSNLRQNMSEMERILGGQNLYVSLRSDPCRAYKKELEKNC